MYLNIQVYKVTSKVPVSNNFTLSTKAGTRTYSAYAAVKAKATAFRTSYVRIM